MQGHDDLEPLPPDADASTQPEPSGIANTTTRRLAPIIVAVVACAAIIGGSIATGVQRVVRSERERTDFQLRELSTRLRQVAPAQSVKVPNVVGLSRREAEAILTVAGFNPVGDPNNPGPLAGVLGQDPAAGAVVERGTAVLLLARPGSDVVQGPVEAAGSAADLAGKAGCAGAQAGATTTQEPAEPRPSAEVQCAYGEARVSIRTYTSEAQVTAALEAVGRYCGYRAVGRSWIAAVDTEETAWRVQNALGGRVVELAGCS